MSKVPLVVQVPWESCSECFEKVRGKRLVPGAGKCEIAHALSSALGKAQSLPRLARPCTQSHDSHDFLPHLTPRHSVSIDCLYLK